MKIGILTFHRAHNYGAVLQAYALVTYLRNIGHQAEIVDYRPDAIEQAHGAIPWGRIKKMSLIGKIKFLVRLLPFIPLRYKRANIFRQFIKSLPTSTRIYTSADTNIDGYDCLLCGSDQVWNSKITNGFDPFYTGQVSTNATFVSYAASAEITPKSEAIEKYKEVLPRFKRISVRESVFQEQLSRLTDCTIEQVLDPVFLLSSDQWKSFSVNPFDDNPYILVYQVRRDDNVLRYAHELADIQHYCVREITAEADFLPNKERHVTLSPQQFVGAFANAKAVVTTSFHGTAFSIIFSKPFVTMMFGKPGDYRALDLINTLGIKDSTITPKSKAADFSSEPAMATNFINILQKSKQYLIFNDK